MEIRILSCATTSLPCKIIKRFIFLFIPPAPSPSLFLLIPSIPSCCLFPLPIFSVYFLPVLFLILSLSFSRCLRHPDFVTPCCTIFLFSMIPYHSPHSSPFLLYLFFSD